MMYQRLFSFFGVALIAIWGQSAVAASVALNPETSTVDAGTTFEVDFFLDASDTAGPHAGNFCGEVRIDYDPNLLTFVASSAALQQLDQGTSGDRVTISFGFSNVIFNTDPDAGVVGSFTFQATEELGSTSIGITDNLALGTFFNHADAAADDPAIIGDPNEFFPSFSPASVQVVPLPAAAWLLLSALGALGLFGRRARAANQAA